MMGAIAFAKAAFFSLIGVILLFLAVLVAYGVICAVRTIIKNEREQARREARKNDWK